MRVSGLHLCLGLFLNGRIPFKPIGHPLESYFYGRISCLLHSVDIFGGEGLFYEVVTTFP